MQFHNEPPAMRKGDVVVSTLLTAILAVSILAGILEALELNVPYIGMILTGGMSAALSQLLFFADRKIQSFGTLAMVGIPCIGILLCNRMISNEAAVIGNHILAFAGSVSETYFLPFSTTEEIAEADALLVVSLVLMVWLTCGVSYLQKEMHPVISICILFLTLIVNGCLPQVASGGWSLVTALCIGLLFVRHNLGDKKLFPFAALLVLGLSGVIWFGAVICGQPLEEGKARLTTASQQTISDSVTLIRYGQGENRSMPMGNFENLGDLEFSDAEMLKIKGKTFESLYLRGFVGGVFDGRRWNSVDGRTLYDNGKTFYWLHDGGYYGQNLLAKSALILDPKTEKGEQSYSIENLGADGRVYYTPYELTTLQVEGKRVLDNQLLTEDALPAKEWNGWNYYEIKTLENQVKRYPELILTLIENLKSKNLSDFRKAESHYNRFVYENYTYLTKEEKNLMEKYLGKADLEKGSHMVCEEAKTKILSCLDDNVVYSKKLLSHSDGHFVKNFLETDKSGYSVHYASAATLMFRYFGIPARYVEGYLITPDAVKAATGKDALILTDQDAHAWVEYYQDGIGWLPFEVTPPYRDVMEQPEPLQSANSQAVSEGGSTSLGMEMIEDNYEPENLEREEPKRTMPWNAMAIGGLALLLLLLLVLSGLHLWKRNRKVAARLADFQQEDGDQAVKAMFGYCMLLHTVLGIQLKNCSVYDYSQEIGRIAGDEVEKNYRNVAEIYQKAAYSQSVVTQEERQQVWEYKEILIGIVKDTCSLPKHIRLKWGKGLY